MFLLSHHWHLDFRRKRIRDQKGLWITSFFRQLGFALIGVFSVVFVFQLGSNHFLNGGIENGLAFLLSYMIILFGAVSLCVVWIAKNIIHKIGYRRSVIMSLILTSLGFANLALADITQIIWFVWTTGVVQGLGICFYWVTYYTLFSEDTNPKQIGSSFGLLDAFAKFGQIIAPLFGAFLTIFFGYKAIFLLGIIFLLISAIPMLFLKHHLHLDEVSFSELKQWSKEPRFLRLAVSLGGKNIQEKLLAQLWPIYVFLLIGNLEGLGLFQAVLLLASTIFTLIVARFFDKSSKKKFLVMGVLGNQLFWMTRLWLFNLPQILIVDSADKLFQTVSRTYYFGYLFRRADGKQAFSFVVYWIFWESLLLITALIILLLILVLFGVQIFWFAMVIMAMLGGGLSLLIQDHK